MAIEQLPVFTDSTRYDYTCAIEDTDYVFEFFLGSRQNRWYVSVKTVDQQEIVSGVKLSLGTDIFETVVSSNFFEGQVVPLKLDDSSGEITEEDLRSGNVILLHLTGDDVEEFTTPENYVETVVAL